MLGTRQVRRELRRHGFKHLAPWSRGVDTELFRPRPEVRLPYPAPILIFVGRVAVEKSVEDVCRSAVAGTKLVVGGGPQLGELDRRHPDVVFTGYKYGLELATLLAGSDCFVFPSRTDTFGLVLLEAMACGVPIAAYPVTGPIDVVRNDETGCLRQDLAIAITAALALDPARCRAQALEYRWEKATGEFLGNLVDARGQARGPRGRRDVVDRQRERARPFRSAQAVSHAPSAGTVARPSSLSWTRSCRVNAASHVWRSSARSAGTLEQVVDRGRERAARVGDHRQAAGHRLERDEAERLLAAGVHECIRGGDPGGDRAGSAS